VDGSEPKRYFNLSSYNNGVFRFEIKRYKYLYLRASQDYSGSQALIRLDSKKTYELIPEQFSQQDVVYTEHNVGKEAEDDTLCKWTIAYNIDMVLEKKLIPQDVELYEQFLEEIE
jgi:hypothetical protein